MWLRYVVKYSWITCAVRIKKKCITLNRFTVGNTKQIHARTQPPRECCRRLSLVGFDAQAIGQTGRTRDCGGVVNGTQYMDCDGPVQRHDWRVLCPNTPNDTRVVIILQSSPWQHAGEVCDGRRRIGVTRTRCLLPIRMIKE